MVEEPRSEQAAKPAAATKKPSSSSIWVYFAAILIGAVVLAVLITYSTVVNRYSPAEDEEAYRFRALREYMESLAYYDNDYDAMLEAAIRAYVGATDDDYTVYYDAEEFEQLNQANQGNYVGIGVSVEQTVTMYENELMNALRVAIVHKNSPAQKAGLLRGDEILAIKTEAGKTFVNDVSYTAAVALIRGEQGSSVELSVLREVGDERVLLDLKVLREELFLEAVDCRVSSTDATVGIVTITSFDLTTPTTLKKSMNALLEQGIERFVIDMRDNGGGDLASLVACASYFLEKNDLILTTEDKDGNKVIYNVMERKRVGTYAPCSVAEEEIGMYRGYSYAVLINGNTASAAELLTAVFRDYSLGSVIGEQSFGKGSVQSVLPLDDIGLEGGLRITTRMYFPPCGVGYQDIGITPDFVMEFPKDKHIGTVSEAEDTQLMCAIDQLIKPKSK